MKIYLVEDIGNSPGRIYACMKDKDDAEFMAAAIEGAEGTECEVVERTLFYGQPPRPGYCE